MALRNVLTVENENDSLRKVSREIEKIDQKILTLIEDMKETLYEKNGVGLAAPQIGVLKRIIVIDIENSWLTKYRNDKPDERIVELLKYVVQKSKEMNFYRLEVCDRARYLVDT